MTDAVCLRHIDLAASVSTLAGSRLFLGCLHPHPIPTAGIADQRSYLWTSPQRHVQEEELCWH